PVAVDKEFCHNETISATGSCGSPATVSFEVTAASVLNSTLINWYDADPTAGPANQLTNPYGDNCRFFPGSSYPGGMAQPTTGRVYSLWATYIQGASNTCESPPVEVKVTFRPQLTTSLFPNPTGSTQVCNGSDDVAYS